MITKKYFELISYINECITVDLEELVKLEREADKLYNAGLDVPAVHLDMLKILNARIQVLTDLDSKFGF